MLTCGCKHKYGEYSGKFCWFGKVATVGSPLRSVTSLAMGILRRFTVPDMDSFLLSRLYVQLGSCWYLHLDEGLSVVRGPWKGRISFLHRTSTEDVLFQVVSPGHVAQKVMLTGLKRLSIHACIYIYRCRYTHMYACNNNN